ncbi:MAG: hypothetical protein WDW38_010030, partial [Sanguina aurantia]
RQDLLQPPRIDHHLTVGATRRALGHFEIPQFPIAQQHILQPLQQDSVVPGAVTDLHQRLCVGFGVHLVQLAEGGVHQQRLELFIEQGNRFAHGLQDQLCAEHGRTLARFGHLPPSDLALGQHDDNAKQQQLPQRRDGQHHPAVVRLVRGERLPLHQQLVLVLDERGDLRIDPEQVACIAQRLSRAGAVGLPGGSAARQRSAAAAAAAAAAADTQGGGGGGSSKRSAAAPPLSPSVLSDADFSEGLSTALGGSSTPLPGMLPPPPPPSAPCATIPAVGLAWYNIHNSERWLDRLPDVPISSSNPGCSTSPPTNAHPHPHTSSGPNHHHNSSSSNSGGSKSGGRATPSPASAPVDMRWQAQLARLLETGHSMAHGNGLKVIPASLPAAGSAGVGGAPAGGGSAAGAAAHGGKGVAAGGAAKAGSLPREVPIRMPDYDYFATAPGTSLRHLR